MQKTLHLKQPVRVVAGLLSRASVEGADEGTGLDILSMASPKLRGRRLYRALEIRDVRRAIVGSWFR